MGQKVDQTSALQFLFNQGPADKRDTLTGDRSVDDGRSRVDAQAPTSTDVVGARFRQPLRPSREITVGVRRSVVDQGLLSYPPGSDLLAGRQQSVVADGDDLFAHQKCGFDARPDAQAAAYAYVSFALRQVDDAVGDVQAHVDRWMVHREIVELWQKPVRHQRLRRRHDDDGPRLSTAQLL